MKALPKRGRDMAIEVTDRDIRDIGENRYVRARYKQCAFGCVLLMVIMGLASVLMPDEPTVLEEVGLTLLGLLPAVLALFWAFVRVEAAGRRFLAEWKSNPNPIGGKD